MCMKQYCSPSSACMSFITIALDNLSRGLVIIVYQKGYTHACIHLSPTWLSQNVEFCQSRALEALTVLCRSTSEIE